MGAGGVKANKEVKPLKQHVEVAENKPAATLPQRSFARPATRSLCPRHPGRRMPFARRRAGRAGRVPSTQDLECSASEAERDCGPLAGRADTSVRYGCGGLRGESLACGRDRLARSADQTTSSCRLAYGLTHAGWLRMSLRESGGRPCFLTRIACEVGT